LIPVYDEQTLSDVFREISKAFGGLDCIKDPFTVRREQLNLLFLALEASTNGNALSCLYFVSCQHPHLNTGVPQGLNSLLNIVLQLVFHTCNPKQFHV